MTTKQTAKQLTVAANAKAFDQIVALLRTKHSWLASTEAYYLATEILATNLACGEFVEIVPEDLSSFPRSEKEYVGTQWQDLLRSLKVDTGLEFYVLFKRSTLGDETGCDDSDDDCKTAIDEDYGDDKCDPSGP